MFLAATNDQARPADIVAAVQKARFVSLDAAPTNLLLTLPGTTSRNKQANALQDQDAEVVACPQQLRQMCSLAQHIQ